MKIKVKVKTNAKQNLVKETPEFILVLVKEKAEKGKANKEVIKVLADYFSVPSSKVKILKGLNSRNKVIELDKEIKESKTN